MKQIPEIRVKDKHAMLYVDGEPFFALCGEIHNSSASSLSYMEKEVWPRLRGMNMNSVIVPLSWELIEEQPGQYDFQLLDGLIAQARGEGMRLIFIWFGLWKNGESMYVPGWMKQDRETYFLAEKADKSPLATISPLCQAAVEKDARAFAAVMRHIRETDEEHSTVLMMQVENEIGLLGTDCDYSAQARAAFAEEIPEELAKLCHRKGSWAQAFGEQAGENFMAYHFARAVETIVSAGRREYPLPCYTNAWLKQYPWYPGSYPSGGPVREVHWIWKAAAPSLFTLAPDIYVPYVSQVMDEYSYEGNPLFVPEVRKDAVTASYCLYAFGKHQAVGYSPFGIEELALSPEEIEKPPMEVMAALNIDPSAFDITGSREYLSQIYGLINQWKPLLLRNWGNGRLQSYLKKSETDFGAFFRFTEYDLLAAYAPKAPAKPLGAGLILELSANCFLVAGMMSSLQFQAKAGENVRAGYLKLEEGHVENGVWVPGRRLNGDEKMTVSFKDMPCCYYVELYKY